MEREELYLKIEAHYRFYRPMLVAKLTRQVGSRSNAEDVIQTMYLRACEYWRTYDEDNFEGWMRIILNNATRDHFKAVHLNGQSDGTEAYIMEGSGFTRIQLLEALDKIDSMADNIKRILKLILLEGFKSNEVAMVVPESSLNIRKIVERFRREIKNA